MSTGSDLLRLPAGEAARRLVKLQLGRAREQAARLHDPSDEEALHDFRVALRRLRSLLRAWKPALKPAIGKAERAELKAVQGETGAGRDAEVALEWLAERRDGLSTDEASGLDWLASRLRSRREAAMEHARERVSARFAEADEHLRARLDDRGAAGDAETGRPFGRVVAGQARRHLQPVIDLLGDAGEPPAAERLHRGRIATKRLRYLVEALRESTDSAGPLVNACKDLQDVLGDLNDAAVFDAELDSAAEVAPAGAGPGLAALRRLNAQRRDRLLSRLREDWLADGLERLQRGLTRLTDELGGAPAAGQRDGC